MINNISFKAKYINSDTVQKRILFSKFSKPKTVDFVELDAESEMDKTAVSEIGETWDNGDSFARVISRNMQEDSLYHAEPRKYFAIVKEGTAQKLKPKDILGIAEIKENSAQEVYLNFIQVIPPYCNDNSNFFKPNISKIGTALMRNLCKTFSDKDILLRSIYTTKYFYKKFGFEKISYTNNTNKMIRKARKVL